MTQRAICRVAGPLLLLTLSASPTLAAEDDKKGVDFRAIRYPGLISAHTLPSGGTSDFAPEMIHSAAKGEKYPCFVRADTRIPFMAMPSAITALLKLMDAPSEALSTHVYNIRSFNPSAGEFAELVRAEFPEAEITFEPDLRRQAIVDSWPEDVDDTLAREEWGFEPQFDLETAFASYMLPHIRQRYAEGS